MKSPATIASILSLLGNVDHSRGGGENAARVYGGMLESIRTLATEALKTDELEVRARTIIEAAREKEWAPSRQIILSAFSAQWMYSLPVHRVVRIGCALHNQPENDDVTAGISKQLTKLVREGFLSSRMDRGVRVYELDLTPKTEG
jgi:hypothetical protein